MDSILNIGNSLAMLVTTIVMKKYDLNMMYYGAIFPLCIALFNICLNLDYIFLLEYWYYLSIPIFIFTCYYFKDYTDVLKFWKKNSKIVIMDQDTLKVFKRYVDINKDIYLGSKDITYGDIDMIHMMSAATYNKSMWSEKSLDITIHDLYQEKYFKDTNLDVEGTIEWRKSSRRTEVSPKNKNEGGTSIIWFHIYPVIMLNTRKSAINASKFMKKVSKFLKKYDKENINLKYAKVIRIKHNEKTNRDYDDHIVSIYKGKPQLLEEKEEIFINSFFHMQKDKIWSTLKKIHYEPEFFHKFGQNPRMNMLLYGPPGSGKSSFVYRIARCLNRHIISLDLTSIKSKKDLYGTIQRPYINGAFCDARDIIIVLEEFDIAIKKLYTDEQEDLMKKKQLDVMINNYSNKTLQKIIKKNDSESIFNEDYDRIYLRDLLDILQGTIPIDGSIIVATSNKYEEIKDFCPELFRNGRMTPIYFGYLDENNFKNVCKYYFGSEPKQSTCDAMFSDKESCIKTSKIIEKALEVKLMYENDIAFTKFEEYLITKKQ